MRAPAPLVVALVQRIGLQQHLVARRRVEAHEVAAAAALGAAGRGLVFRQVARRRSQPVAPKDLRRASRRSIKVVERVAPVEGAAELAEELELADGVDDDARRPGELGLLRVGAARGDGAERDKCPLQSTQACL